MKALKDQLKDKSNILDSRHLNHPLQVGGVHSVLVEPAGELGPLISIAAIDRQTGLCILVSCIFKVTSHFLGHKGQR